ncbi:MAG TPA: hypothetical protein VJ757_09370 [Pseudonocardiaceae bacterium]|nr:hypothetical protein [Pseudonocardiaceae bacterium]
MVISKGGTFCLPQHIESFAADVFGRLAAVDMLRGRGRELFIDGLTELLAARSTANRARHVFDDPGTTEHVPVSDPLRDTAGAVPKCVPVLDAAAWQDSCKGSCNEPPATPATHDPLSRRNG